jgi:hypothetical protein
MNPISVTVKPGGEHCALLGVMVDDAHGGSVSRIAFDNGCADAGAATGHDDDSVLVIHVGLC